jgi:alpha-mannosidase
MSDSYAGPVRAMALDALERLAVQLERRKYAMPATKWRLRASDGADREVTLSPYGRFRNLLFRPGVRLSLSTDLTLPNHHAGLAFDGANLRADLFSRFPMQLRVDGEVVFDCPDPPNARGIATIPLVAGVEPRRTYRLDLDIEVPERLIAFGVVLRLSTEQGRARWHRADAAWSKLLLAASRAKSVDEAELIRALPELCARPIGLDLDRFTDSLERAAEGLRPLLDEHAMPPVHMVSHAHVDIEWLWDWPQTKTAFTAVCETALDLLDRVPQLKFSLSQAALYEVVRQEQPAMFDAIAAQVRAGRWEALTSTWVEGDVNLPSGESLARELLAGRLFSERYLDGGSGVWSLPDNFGLTPELPQFLTKAGLRAFYHIRCDPMFKAHGGAYRWRASDGTTAIGVSADSYDAGLMASRVARAAAAAEEYGLSAGILLFGVDGFGAHGVPEDVARVEALSRESWFPDTVCSTLDGYVDAIAEDPLPDFAGEGPTMYEGSYTSIAQVKQRHRRAEAALLQAETASLMAGQPGELDAAWRRLLHLHHHDIIRGTSVVPPEQLDAHCGEIDAASDASLRAAVDRLAQGQSGPIVVVNPLPWARDAVVVADAVPALADCAALTSDGTDRIPVWRPDGRVAFRTRLAPWEVRSFGPAPDAATVSAPPLLTAEDPPEDLLVGEENPKRHFTFANRFFHGVVRGDAGAIVSLVDGASGMQLVNYGRAKPGNDANTSRPELGLNVLQLLQTRPHAMSAWHHHEVALEESLLSTGETAWHVRDELFAVLRTAHKIGPTSVVQDMTVYRDLPWIDVVLHVDWQHGAGENDGMPALKVAFTPDVPDPDLHVGVPYGVARRQANGQEASFQRWLDVSNARGGLAVLADDRYGYDALGPRVRLTLVRSFYDPTLNQDCGRHTFAYTMLPHAGTWRDAALPVLAEEWARPPLVALAEGSGAAATPAALPRLDPASGAVVTCVKPAARGGGTVLRVHQWSGVAGTAVLDGIPDGTTCWRAAFTEEPVEPLPVEGGRVRLDLAPGAVETLLLR